VGKVWGNLHRGLIFDSEMSTSPPPRNRMSGEVVLGAFPDPHAGIQVSTVAVMIKATLVNTQTHMQTDGQTASN